MTNSVNSPGRTALTEKQEAWSRAVIKLLKLGLAKEGEAADRRGVDPWNITSLHNRYSERYEQAMTVEKTEAEERLERNQRERNRLTLEIAEKKDTATQRELLELERQRDEIDEEIEEDKTALELMVSTKMRLDTIETVEGDLEGMLSGLGTEIGELEEALSEAFDSRAEAIEALNPREAERFRFEYNAIANDIEQAIKTVFPMAKLIPGPEGTTITETRNYTAIDNTEYAILYGMLEKAELIFLTPGKGYKDAMIELERTRRQLETFRAARMGSDVVTAPPSESTPLDSFLLEIEGRAALLRVKGYAHAADELMLQHGMLFTQIQRMAKTSPETVAPSFAASVQNLREHANNEVAAMQEIERELDKVELAVRTFRANEQTSYANRCQRKLEAFDRDRPLPACLIDAKALFERYERHARHGIDRKLEEASTEEHEISREALEEKLKEIRETYDSLFKHQKDGSVKMIIDSKTREEKGAKKNTNLPREAIREFELMMMAAEQLLESGSVDALKKAEMWLAGTQTAMDNVKQNPRVYLQLQQVYDYLKNELNRIAKSYAMFAIGERGELMQELAECEKELKTVFQRELQNRMRDLRTDITEHKSNCVRLKGRQKALKKESKSVKGVLDQIGKELVAWRKSGKTSIEYDGYWGDLRTELTDCNSKIERGQKTPMDEAQSELREIRVKAETVLGMFIRMKSGAVLEHAEQRKMMAFLREAKAGQQTHTESEAVHEEYSEYKIELKSDIKALVKLLKSLKMDPTDAEVLEQRRSSVRSEVKSNKNYPQGLKDLKEIRKDYARLKQEADDAQEIVDKSVVEIAEDVKRKIATFRREIGAFLDGTVKPAGGEDYDGVNTGKLAGFVTMLDGAVPQAKVEDIVSKSRLVADSSLGDSERKLARRVALAAVRALMQVFDGFHAMAHYRANPFAASEAVGALRRVLPRLEIKLLTAIGK